MTNAEGLTGTATSRHDPVRLSTVNPTQPRTYRFGVEPVLTGLVHLTHQGQSGAVPVPVSVTPLVFDEHVIVAGYDGRVRRFDRNLEDSKVLFRIREPIYATPVIDRQRGVVVMGGLWGSVVAFDVDGNIVWRHRTRGKISASPTLLENGTHLAVVDRSKCLTILETRSGQVTNCKQLQGNWRDAVALPGARSSPFATPLALEDSLVYVDGPTIVRVDTGGKTIWSRTVSAEVRASPAVDRAGGGVLIGATDGTICVLSAANGAIQERWSVPARVTASPVFGSGLALVPSAAGVYALRRGSDQIDVVSPYVVRDHGSVTTSPDCDLLFTSGAGSVVTLRPDGAFCFEATARLEDLGEELTFDGTPVCTVDGYLYAASYQGYVAAFRYEAVEG